MSNCIVIHINIEMSFITIDRSSPVDNHNISIIFAWQIMLHTFFFLFYRLRNGEKKHRKQDGKRAKAPAVLVRPLPWIFFLPALIVMRYTRVILSLVSICCGFNEIESTTMVTFLHQTRRNARQISNEAKRNQIKETQQYSWIAHVKRIFLLVLSNLSKLITPASDPIKVHSNKTSVTADSTNDSLFLFFSRSLSSWLHVCVFISKQLNAAEIDKTTQPNEKDDEISSFSDDSNSDDQAYHDFLSRTIQESDTDDENFVNELNGDDTSDTDSQSSVATEDLSDDEKHRSANVSVWS